MSQDAEGGEQNPILHPHVISKLKDRHRLVDFGVRRDMLEQLEATIAERRKPKHVAKRTSRKVMSDAKDAGEQVMSKRLEKRLERTSSSFLTD